MEQSKVDTLNHTHVIKVDVDIPMRKVVHYRSTEDKSTGEIESKFVIDASGQAAVIAKQLGFRIFDDELKFSAISNPTRSVSQQCTAGISTRRRSPDHATRMETS